MGKVTCPENVLIEIPVSDLRMKKENLRLSQMCAAYHEGKLELSYSFANDQTYELKTLRIVTDRETLVPSITELYSCAVFYENEMRELSGVNIQMMDLDYHEKLYRIGVETPLAPKEDK